MIQQSNKLLFQQAERLANRPYQVMTFLDRTTEGELIQVALIPELPGCHTHGETIEEAIALLHELKIEFIYFMLEDGLDIPEPCLFDDKLSVNLGENFGHLANRLEQSAGPYGAILVA